MIIGLTLLNSKTKNRAKSCMHYGSVICHKWIEILIEMGPRWLTDLVCFLCKTHANKLGVMSRFNRLQRGKDISNRE